MFNNNTVADNEANNQAGGIRCGVNPTPIVNNIVWNNTGSDFDPSGHDGFSPVNDGQWYNVNVSALVRAWIDGDFPNQGLTLIASPTQIESKYSSMEGQSSHRSCLEVVTAP